MKSVGGQGERKMAKNNASVAHGNEAKQKNESEIRFETLVETLLNNTGVTFGSSEKKGFGSSALKINGKIFAMMNSKGSFVVKLPRQRVEVLTAAGLGERFDPGHGRVMKEWLTLASGAEDHWLPLAREAMEFVGSSR